MDFEDSVAAVDADDKVVGYLQLARPQPRDLAEEVSKGSKSFTACWPTTASTRRRRVDLRPARPVAAVRPQRRSPDDQPGDPRRRRQRGPRGYPGRAVHLADRQAWIVGGGQAELAHRGRSTSSSPRCTDPTRWRSPRSCSVASRRFSGCREHPQVGIMDEERRTTVNLKAAIKPPRAASCSSTPASSTAPATRSTPPWRPARSARAT